MTTLLHIVSDTPRWVFALFFLLLALGLRQMRERQVSRARSAMVSIAMAAFSCCGLASDFGARPPQLAAWGAGAWLVLFLMLRKPEPHAAVYDAATGMLRVPGSAVPLLLMLTVFVLKYAVAVALTMKPALREELSRTLVVAALYGIFSGLFAGRALRLLRARTVVR